MRRIEPAGRSVAGGKPAGPTVQHSPDATLIVVTNPLDQMTTLAADVSGLPRAKVMGQAGILDSSRFAHFISEVTGEDILSIKAVTPGEWQEQAGNSLG